MLLAGLVSALILTQAPTDRWACDLAPSLGVGSADEGDIDNFTSLSLGCRYELFQVYGIGVSPTLTLDKQMWSVYEGGSQAKNIYGYDTQDYLFGLRFSRNLSEHTKIFYGFAAGFGTGSLELTESTTQTSLNADYNGLTQQLMTHTLGGSYGLTDRLALSLAWQRQDATQKWNVTGSDIFVQNVDDNNSLTLTDGNSTSLTGSSFRSKNSTSVNSIQIGLSFSFGG
ncbi:MAG: hypothetical protein V4655_09000 [Bdellovibrionota bacterium]